MIPCMYSFGLFSGRKEGYILQKAFRDLLFVMLWDSDQRQCGHRGSFLLTGK